MSKVFTFFWNNKDWMFSGIGVVVLVGVVAFFRRRLRKAEKDVPPLTGHQAGPEQTPSQETRAPEAAPGSSKRTSTITYRSIMETIEKTPPLQREQAAENFIGIKVDWETSLSSASRDDKDMVSLLLEVRDLTKTRHAGLARCTVPLHRYRELAVLPEGIRIRVQGEIEKVDTLFISLKNVRLFFEGD